MEILLAIGIGGAFGAVLDRVGATDPNVLGRMLALRDLRLMKAILLGIGVAAVLIFGGLMAGLVDPGHISIKTAHWGVLIGGALLGLGWALSGYCPGTGICAAASGRRDAWAYVAGGLLGALAYTLVFPGAKASGLLDPILGGKTTLGAVPGTEFPALIALRGDLVGLALGVVFIAVAVLLPERRA